MTKQGVTNDEIMATLSQFADGINKRFDAVADDINKRFDAVDMRLFRLENDVVEIKREIIDLRASHDRLPR